MKKIIILAICVALSGCASNVVLQREKLNMKKMCSMEAYCDTHFPADS
jgi:uncharacterized protein YceK